MDNIEKIQSMVPLFANKKYMDCYLWKYLEFELTTGVLYYEEDLEKNIPINNIEMRSIPDASEEQISQIESTLDSLENKKYLFGLIPIRRPYKGKLEHTGLDSYIDVMDNKQYYVVEPNYGGHPDNIVYTQNRIRYVPSGVVGYYGKKEVDENELMQFLYMEYVMPLEQKFGVKIPKVVIIKSFFKALNVLQERSAHIKFFEDVLERVKPDVICFAHGPDQMMIFLNEAAHNKNIPTIEIEHGAIIRNIVYPKNLQYSDYYFTHSDLLTNPMKKKGFQNVFTVGKPHVYDNVNRKVKSSEPIVVSVISSREKELFEKMIRLVEKLDKKKYLFVYKMHPTEKWNDKDMINITEKYSNIQFLDGFTDIRDLLELSDIVIGERSSGILDALPYNKVKVIALRDSNNGLVGDFSFFDELDELRDIVIVNSDKELYDEVVMYSRGKEYRDKINHYWPYDAEKKFKETVEEIIRNTKSEEKKC